MGGRFGGKQGLGSLRAIDARQELPPSSLLGLCLAAGGTPAAYPWNKQAGETPHPSSISPQRNPVPTQLTVRLPRRKVFIIFTRNGTSKRSFVTGRLGTLPAASVTRWESCPPHPTEEQYLAACSSLSSAGTPGGPGAAGKRRLRRCAAPTALHSGSSRGAGTRRSAANHTAAGGGGKGGGGDPGSRNRMVRCFPGSAESITHTKPRAPSSGTHRSPKEWGRTSELLLHADQGVLPHHQLLLKQPQSPLPCTGYICAIQHSIRFYILLGITFTRVPTADPIPSSSQAV